MVSDIFWNRIGCSVGIDGEAKKDRRHQCQLH